MKRELLDWLSDVEEAADAGGLLWLLLNLMWEGSNAVVVFVGDLQLALPVGACSLQRQSLSC